MSSSKVAIKVSNLSKRYMIGKQKDSSLRGTLSSLFKAGNSSSDEFWALKDLNFEINKGDVIGIIGKNGAGKSTLLKILSQITAPTTGRIEINGRVASLLEVGTGFHPELTGRENIYLNGTILGMTRKEVKAKFDEIVEFSGIEKFIDTPVKRYSSGMYVRLAFAVAAHLEPEILVIDEVLAVGDADFQKKCLGKMQDVANEGRTVIFVSHNMSAVKSLCLKGIVIKNGTLAYSGSVESALTYYNQASCNPNLFFNTSDFTKRSRGMHDIYIKSVEIDKTVYSVNSSISFAIVLDQTTDFVGKLNLAVFIYDSLNNVVYQLSTLLLGVEVGYNIERSYKFSCNELRLSGGVYKIGVWLEGNGLEQDYVDEDLYFEVDSSSIYPNKSAKIVSIVQREFDFQIVS